MKPLMMAAKEVNHVAMVSILLGAGTDAWDVDNLSHNALHYAADAGSCGVMDLLCEAAARTWSMRRLISSCHIDSAGCGGKTPLMLGARNKSDPIVTLLTQQGASHKLRLSYMALAFAKATGLTRGHIQASAGTSAAHSCAWRGWRHLSCAQLRMAWMDETSAQLLMSITRSVADTELLNFHWPR
ncbi:hypothetical protein FOA52_009659 [Chlamydomonas sp. UWO 241]|nr:hypothetical protein FOA52_009659 [Chlamydomonas sp. UWO 241]